MEISPITLLIFLIGLQRGWTQTGYIYLGCYQDVSSFEDKVLNDYGGYIPNDLTVDYCFHSCIDEGYEYFGVESQFCFCAKFNADYSRYGPLSENRCSDPCPGDQNQKCGSTDAIRVFRDDTRLCPTIQPIPNGEVDQNGVTVRFGCNLGYRLHGAEFLTCGYNYSIEEFVWNGDPPSCIIPVVTDSPKRPTTVRRVSTASTSLKMTTQREKTTRRLTMTPQVFIYSTTMRQKEFAVTSVNPTTAKRVIRSSTKAHPLRTTYRPIPTTTGKSTTTTTNEKNQKDSQKGHTSKESGASKSIPSSMYNLTMSLIASLLLLKICQ